MKMMTPLLILVAAAGASALQLGSVLRPSPTTVAIAKISAISMRARYEDAEDRRLSKGGSGGRFGKTAPKNRALGVSGMDKYTQSDIRQRKLDAYVNNDLEPTDGTISKIIAGSMLVSIFGLLYAVFAYYGAEGLVAATGRM